MNIMMFTNTFTPHVGGVARSVERLMEDLRNRGHRVVVMAPEFEGQPEEETDVIRVPAIQRFNGSDFSMSIPGLSLVQLADEDIVPDIVHAHHPYLLGDTALRFAAKENCPLVFTHHTMYEKYTHYVPGDSPKMQRFVIELSTGYANMAECVIAPSESVKEIIQERGVESEIRVVPTGVDVERFADGDGTKIRKRVDIPEDAFVIGHLGRLAQEKNLTFLTRAVCRYLNENREAHFLVVGDGPSVEEMKKIAGENDSAGQIHFTGSLSGQDVVDAYHAMNLFAFASKTETQGMVLAEAMAADLPVVALDASGAREVVRDEANGRLLLDETEESFQNAIAWTRERIEKDRENLLKEIRQTAKDFSLPVCVSKCEEIYRSLQGVSPSTKYSITQWDKLKRYVEQEWDLWSNRVSALSEALSPETKGK